MIHRSKLLLVLRRHLPCLQLRGHRRNTLLVHRRHFRRQRLARDSSRTVITGPVIDDVHRRIVHDHRVRDRAVVHGNIGDVHVVDGFVVVEAASVPVPALVAHAHVAKAVINAAVVSDMPSPVSVAITVAAIHVAPVAGSPQITDLRRTRPRARHPEIARGSIAPVPGRPKIALLRAFRLRILRQRWRRFRRLQYWLSIARILVVGIVVVVRIGAVRTPIIVSTGRRWRWRRVVGLRTAGLWCARLRIAHRRQISCCRRILALIGLRRLRLCAVSGLILIASPCERQYEACRCH